MKAATNMNGSHDGGAARSSPVIEFSLQHAVSRMWKLLFPFMFFNLPRSLFSNCPAMKVQWYKYRRSITSQSWYYRLATQSASRRIDKKTESLYMQNDVFVLGYVTHHIAALHSEAYIMNWAYCLSLHSMLLFLSVSQRLCAIVATQN